MNETPSVKSPEVSYVRSGDVAIAYQVGGSGPPDIVFVRGVTGDLLSTWEQPLKAHSGARLSAFAKNSSALRVVVCCAPERSTPARVRYALVSAAT